MTVVIGLGFCSFRGVRPPISWLSEVHQALRSQLGSVGILISSWSSRRLYKVLDASNMTSWSLGSARGSKQQSLTLYETSQHLAPSLQKRMSNHDLQESLQALSPMLNHIIAESICKDLSRQRWNGNARRFPLQDVAEVFEVRVAPPYTAVAELKCRYIRTTYNLVVGVHAAAHSMCAWILDLGWGQLL